MVMMAMMVMVAIVVMMAMVVMMVIIVPPDDEHALGDLVGPLPERVHPVVAVQAAVLLRVEVRRVVEVLSFPLAHPGGSRPL